MSHPEPSHPAQVFQKEEFAQHFPTPVVKQTQGHKGQGEAGSWCHPLRAEAARGLLCGSPSRERWREALAFPQAQPSCSPSSGVLPAPSSRQGTSQQPKRNASLGDVPCTAQGMTWAGVSSRGRSFAETSLAAPRTLLSPLCIAYVFQGPSPPRLFF